MLFVAIACLATAGVWLNSASRLRRVVRRAEDESGHSSDVATVARSSYRKDLHAALLYAVLALSSIAAAFVDETWSIRSVALVLIPVVVSVIYGRDFVRDAKLAEGRLGIERRAQEVLSQEDLAPRRWAERLAPGDLPVIAGYEVGRVYQAGTGLMAGDFYHVIHMGPSRVAAVVGDVTGHGIDASITAFQAKYLLRVFLRQYRDPAQAMEELNAQLSALDRGEEMISLCVVVLDAEAATLRYASAGHPPMWLYHNREVQPLAATGPLLMLDPHGAFHSKEIELRSGDLVLLYTDGLSEARSGDALFGEERIASAIRRDPGAHPEDLVNGLLEAAKEFARGPITDDIAILALRCE